MSAAVYQRYPVEELDTHPLIAALRPPPNSLKEAVLRLRKRPSFTLEERDLAAPLRIVLIDRLRRYWIPEEQDAKLLFAVYSQVFNGYLPRNPMIRDGQYFLHHRSFASTDRDSKCPSTILMITGPSGSGKSTLLGRLLDCLGEPLIDHVSFRGVPFPERQLLFLRRNLPEHCTPRALGERFGFVVDRALGTNYESRFTKLRAATRGAYDDEIGKILVAHHLGVLCLDDIQNLSLVGVGAKQIAAMICNLRDQTGVPIIAVGTPRAAKLLENELSLPRRVTEDGSYELRRPSNSRDKHWQAFCHLTWRYQWVRKPVSYSDAIGDALHQYSGGIKGIALTNFRLAQREAILSGAECVTAETLRDVYETILKPIHPAIRILHSGDASLLLKYDDLFHDLWPKVDRGAPPPDLGIDDEDMQSLDAADADAEARAKQKSRRRVKAKPLTETTATKRSRSRPALPRLNDADALAKLLLSSDSDVRRFFA